MMPLQSSLPAARSSRARWYWLIAFLSAATLGVSGCSREPDSRGANAPRELQSERRLSYLLATPAAVMTDLATATKPGAEPVGADERLQRWVKRTMRGASLMAVDEARDGYDVEVRLAVEVNHVGRLTRGRGAMQVIAGGQVLAQWVTDEHVEPAHDFDPALALDLVERLSKSSGLASYADSVYGHRTRPLRETVGLRSYVPEHGGTPPLEQVQDYDNRGRSSEFGVAFGAPRPEPSPEDVSAAGTQAEKAKALFDSRDFQGGYTAYEDAFLIHDDAEFVYAMAECQRNLGNQADASGFYRDYLRRAPEGPHAADARARAGVTSAQVK